MVVNSAIALLVQTVEIMNKNNPLLQAIEIVVFGCCARPVVDFFERLASRAFQKNQQQI
jgi:hypothetical protein